MGRVEQGLRLCGVTGVLACQRFPGRELPSPMLTARRALLSHPIPPAAAAAPLRAHLEAACRSPPLSPHRRVSPLGTLGLYTGGRGRAGGWVAGGGTMLQVIPSLLFNPPPSGPSCPPALSVIKKVQKSHEIYTSPHHPPKKEKKTRLKTFSMRLRAIASSAIWPASVQPTHLHVFFYWVLGLLCFHGR